MTDYQRAIEDLDDGLLEPIRVAIIQLATEPSDDRPDSERFGAGTSQMLTSMGILGDDGFVTEFGIAAGWAFSERDSETEQLEQASASFSDQHAEVAVTG